MLVGRLANPLKLVASAKACLCHRCKVKISGTFARDISRFFTFLAGTFSRKSLIKSERNDQFQAGKF